MRSGNEGGVPVTSPEVPTSTSSSPSVAALHHPSSQVVCLLTTEEDRGPVFIPFTHSCPAPALPHLPSLFFLPAPGQPPPWAMQNQLYPTNKGFKSDINDEPQGGKRQRLFCPPGSGQPMLTLLQERQGPLQAVVSLLVTSNLSYHPGTLLQVTH